MCEVRVCVWRGMGEERWGGGDCIKQEHRITAACTALFSYNNLNYLF